MSTKAEIEMMIIYAHWIEQSDIPIESNAMASGDPKADKETEKWIKGQLAMGNEAAWCNAVVEASIEMDGEVFRGRSYLGCCSYESEAALWKDLLTDQEGEARDDLLRMLDDAVKRGRVAASFRRKLKQTRSPA